jgi:TP901 family phage tail tape measure protein
MAEREIAFKITVEHMNENIASIVKMKDRLKELATERKKLEKQEKSGKITTEQSIKARTKLAQEEFRLRQEITKTSATARKQSKALVSGAGSMAKMRAQTALMREKMEQLNLTTKKGRAELARMQRTYDKNVQSIRKFDRAMSGSKTLVGEYSRGINRSFATLAAGFAGAYAAYRTLDRIIGGAIRTTIDFEKKLSSLSAITGAVGDDLDFLKEKAISFSIGSTHAAADVLEAFESVGSIRPELLKDGAALAEVTRQAIILSEATGGKLGLQDSAIALVGTMNQFELQTKDAAKAVDILVAAQTYGSAQVKSLTETFKNFGTVAEDSNLTLQQGAAIAEVVAKKMIDEAEAGTKLTSTLINLKNAGAGYESGQFDLTDALREVKKQVDELGTSLEKDAKIIEIFGKRNITVGTILLNNIDLYEDMIEKVDENGIALEKQKTQTDNVASSMKRMSNAWEGLILNTNNSSGVMAYALNAIAIGITNVGKSLDSSKQKSDSYWSSSVKFTKARQEAGLKYTEDIEEQIELLNELKRTDPYSFLGTEFYIEKIDELTSRLVIETEEYLIQGKKIDELKEKQEELNNKKEALTEYEEKLIPLLKEEVEKLEKLEEANQTQIETLTTLKTKLKEANEEKDLINTNDLKALIISEAKIEALTEEIALVELLTTGQSVMRQDNLDTMQAIGVEQMEITDETTDHMKDAARRMRDHEKRMYANRIKNAKDFAGEVVYWYGQIEQSMRSMFEISNNLMDKQAIDDEKNLENMYDVRLSLLETSLNQGQITQQQFDDAAILMEDDKNKEIAAIRLRQAKYDRGLASVQLFIDWQIGMMKAFANAKSLEEAIGAMAIMTLQHGLGQVALATAPYPEYATGGMIPNYPGSDTSDNILAWLSPNESVINARSMKSNDVISVTGTPRDIASDINSYKGYGKKFATGFVPSSTISSAAQQTDMRDIVRDAILQIGEIPVTIVDKQIHGAARKVQIKADQTSL